MYFIKKVIEKSEQTFENMCFELTNQKVSLNTLSKKTSSQKIV